jgi:hypothetical protein
MKFWPETPKEKHWRESQEAEINTFAITYEEIYRSVNILRVSGPVKWWKGEETSVSRTTSGIV